MPRRILNKIRRDGLRSGIEAAGEQARQRFFFDETHFWYERTFASEDTKRIPMSLGSRLVAGTTNDMDLIEQIPGISVEESLFRLDNGNHLWMAVLDGRPAFSCWTLYGSAPVFAAPRGRIPLPENVAMLEDSISLPGLRNQALARCTIQNVIHLVREMGYASIITRIRDDNKATQRLVSRLEYRKTTSNRYRRFGLAKYGFVSGDDTPMTHWIAKHLEL